MKTRYALFEVVHGKEQKLKQWFQKLHTEKRREASKTLIYENCLFERIFWFEIGGKAYLLSTADHIKDLVKMDLSVPINAEHANMLEECLGKVQPSELILSLENPELPASLQD